MIHHSTSVKMKKALSRERRGFTLVEMVVVVAITIALMAIMLPALKGLRGSKQSFAATTQFIGDLSTARLMAMNNGSPVYVVFMPLTTSGSFAPSAVPYFEDSEGGNPRLGGQLVSYAFYAEYVLGDSLGSRSRRWLSDWKQLPEGAFFPSAMLDDLQDDNDDYADDMDIPDFSVPHVRNGPPVVDMKLPYIGFDARGEVIGVKRGSDRGAIIRLAEGGVLPPEIDSSTGNYLVQNADEPLNIGRAENYVLINFQTGRARTTVIKAVPAGNKMVKVRIIRFTDRLWKWNAPISTRSHLKGSVGLGKFLDDNRGDATYIGGWSGAYKDTNGDGQQVLRPEWNGPPPAVFKNIPAKLAGKLQEKVLRRDPDAEFLIE